jgi:hypothetical protein
VILALLDVKTGTKQKTRIWVKPPPSDPIPSFAGKQVFR